ncbi:hypothetical protein GARC_0145 [Paraglaciecola arctica BSs20135]|uniref:Uncharacterized protein n=1 Tax=Paraglaciecola arctica BSs20135 TaxID=493475 RepID=K6YG35_9ALTE|nr:hypothetical protein GARC_0145 [Paraglaciecola arctica BSs20135]
MPTVIINVYLYRIGRGICNLKKLSGSVITLNGFNWLTLIAKIY